MKAWRNLNGNVIEIEVDISKSGNPILPPDTTVAERPQELEGHCLTVVGNEWVHIEIPVQVVSFETKKAEALAAVKKYSDWYLDQPVEHAENMFDADEKARNRLVQALVIYNETTYLPPAWINFNNVAFPLTTIDDLKGIISVVLNAFSTRFFEVNALRESLLNAETVEDVEVVTVPTIPTGM
jgi:hypothetical protein